MIIKITEVSRKQEDDDEAVVKNSPCLESTEERSPSASHRNRPSDHSETRQEVNNKSIKNTEHTQ